MNKEQIKKEGDRIHNEYEEANENYDNYIQQFLDGKKTLNKEMLEEVIKLKNIRNKRAKEFWDFVCLIVFPKS